MKNLNTKTDGYYEVRYNGEILSVYAKLKKDSGAEKCKCCGRMCESYFQTYYIDENDEEVIDIYGTECFKKIATFDDSIIAL